MRSRLPARGRRTVAVALALTCVAAAGVPGGQSAAAAPGAGAITTVSDQRLGPRLLELELETPALAAPTGVRVLLPDGYEAHPKRQYPVLYLLHGAGGNSRSWTEAGDAEALTAGLPLIVVMPDSGLGSGYTDWYNDGLLGPPAWETYHVEQLIPWIDRRFRTVASRRGRALAGLSMGGYGALTYAARHPDTFVHSAGFSAAADLTHPALIGLDEAAGGGASPAYGPYSTQEVRRRGANPVDLAANLRGVELSLRTGDGGAGGEFGGGDVVEVVVHQMNTTLHRRLGELGIAHLWDDYGPGGHIWPYWQRDLRLELPRIMESFSDPPRRPRRFSFDSIDPLYDDYGWRVRLDRPQLEFSRLEVDRRRTFSLAGSGSAVVRTPARFQPRRRYELLIVGGDGRRRRTVRANPRGALRVAIDLGPPNAYQQYTQEAIAAGPEVFETAVRIAPSRGSSAG